MSINDVSETLREKPSTPDAEISIIRTSQLPFIDNVEGPIEPRTVESTFWPPTSSTDDDDKPKIRYFSVGPSTEQIKCPLCHLRTDAETLNLTKFLACLMSCCLCCFPICSIGVAVSCLSQRLRANTFFCPKCKGHLGFYKRPV